MADFLLDSDVVIWHLRGKAPVVEKVNALSRQGRLGLSAITRAEIMAGLRERERAATLSFLNACQVLSVDAEVADQGGEMLRQFQAQGITLSLPDALIGATAIQAGIPLYTCNVRHYPSPEIDVRKVEIER